MAAYCLKGGECWGCGACQQEKVVGVCEECGQEIRDYDEHYDFAGELVHYDCLVHWARKYLKMGV